MDQFNSAETACSISSDAFVAMAPNANRDAYISKSDIAKWEGARSKVYTELAKVQADFGQDALNVLGNQLDLQDIRVREKTNELGELSSPVCPGKETYELPGVIVGRNQHNQVTEITFMRKIPNAFTYGSEKLTWKRAE